MKNLRNFSVLTGIVISVISMPAASAVVLGQYVFGANNPGSTSPAAAFEASSVASGLTMGNINLTGSAILPANFFTSQTIAGGQPSRILATQTAGTTQALAITNNSYFQFTLTPDVGQTLDLSSISMDTARGGGSARGFAISSSADGFTTLFSSLAGHPATYVPATGIATQEDVYTNYAFDLSAIADTTTPITFRIYSWSSAPANTIYYDNITLNGSIPEPTTASLGVLASILFLHRRRSTSSN